MVTSVFVFSQTSNYQFDVKKGSSKIGDITLIQTISGGTKTVSLVSDIKYRFIFLFSANSKEEVAFTNGIMTYSNLSREQTGDRNINSRTRKSPGKYTVTVNDKKERELDIHDICYQSLCFYTTEPVNCRQVYVDKYQQLLDIKQVSTHQYKVVFPDNNYNEYFYRDGLCKVIRVHQSLFNVQVELKKVF